MAPKKKKKAPAAQNLINSLLDEKSDSSAELTISEQADLLAPGDMTLDGLELHPQKPLSENSVVMVDFQERSKIIQKPEPQTSSVPLYDLEDVVEVTPGSDFPSLELPSEEPTKIPFEESQANTPQPTPALEYDKTMRIEQLQNQVPTPYADDDSTTPAGKPRSHRDIDRVTATEVKTGARPDKPQRSAPSGSFGHGFSSAEAALKQSESLRVAQFRISELEQELERLRRENEQLATAGETLRRRADELLTKTENSDLQARESQKIFEEEKKVFKSQIQQKERENLELRGRLEETEGRLESNFKKIRVRERELEHRLEIVKMESATLVSTKDKMILDLKRQIDQLTHENEYGKQKSQEIFNQYKDKQETVRRVVRALRIALTILEGDEDSNKKQD